MPGSTADEDLGEASQHSLDGQEDDLSVGLSEEEEAEDFDPNADEADEAYIKKQRGHRRSDALLSCPGCLTTVCIDCQAHDLKDGQYRAMFSINTRSVLTTLGLLPVR